MQRFKAKLIPVPHGGHYVVVPPEVAEATGLRYGARVRGTLDGVAYRSSLMKYSGIFHLGVHKATIAAANVTTGDDVNVAIELDDQPLPTDTVPADLSRALKASKRASDAWASLAPSHRREHVKHVSEAKKADTRARRIVAAIEMLEARAKPASTKPTSSSKPAARAARPAAKRATKATSARTARAAPRARAAQSRSPRAR